jgi:hypothetical protein
MLPLSLGVFLSDIPTKIVYEFIIASMHAVCPAHLVSYNMVSVTTIVLKIAKQAFP